MNEVLLWLVVGADVSEEVKAFGLLPTAVLDGKSVEVDMAEEETAFATEVAVSVPVDTVLLGERGEAWVLWVLPVDVVVLSHVKLAAIVEPHVGMEEEASFSLVGVVVSVLSSVPLKAVSVKEEIVVEVPVSVRSLEVLVSIKSVEVLREIVVSSATVVVVVVRFVLLSFRTVGVVEGAVPPKEVDAVDGSIVPAWVLVLVSVSSVKSLDVQYRVLVLVCVGL